MLEESGDGSAVVCLGCTEKTEIIQKMISEQTLAKGTMNMF